MGKEPGAESATVTETAGTTGAGVQGGDPEQIREDIETTRGQLGDTAAALSQKADVKAQAKQKAEETKASLNEKKEQLLGKARETSPEAGISAATQASETARQNPLPVAAAGAFALGFLIGRASSR